MLYFVVPGIRIIHEDGQNILIVQVQPVFKIAVGNTIILTLFTDPQILITGIILEI